MQTVNSPDNPPYSLQSNHAFAVVQNTFVANTWPASAAVIVHRSIDVQTDLSICSLHIWKIQLPYCESIPHDYH